MTDNDGSLLDLGTKSKKQTDMPIIASKKSHKLAVFIQIITDSFLIQIITDSFRHGHQSEKAAELDYFVSNNG